MGDIMSSQLPKRKPTRLKDFDYSTNGAYFITICTEKRVNILSQIVGEGSPLPQLSGFGNVADRWIKKISEKYNEVTLDNYVIMPSTNSFQRCPRSNLRVQSLYS